MYTLIIADDEYELRRALIHTVDWDSRRLHIKP